MGPLQGNITAQGKLLLQEPLVVSEVSGNDKTKELHLFLFEQCVIFSEAVGKKNQFTSPTYNYKAHVQVKGKPLVIVNPHTTFNDLSEFDPVQKPRIHRSQDLYRRQPFSQLYCYWLTEDPWYSMFSKYIWNRIFRMLYRTPYQTSTPIAAVESVLVDDIGLALSICILFN